jgi:hypothetical protein
MEPLLSAVDALREARSMTSCVGGRNVVVVLMLARVGWEKSYLTFLELKLGKPPERQVFLIPVPSGRIISSALSHMELT